jgi:hypothetical protein
MNRMYLRLKKIIYFRRKPQESWHVSFVESISRIIKPELYVELGIYEAETFNRVNARKKIAVDINPISFSYIENNSNVVSICGTSSNLVEYLVNLENKIDLIFIDADHQVESVVSDFENIEPAMAINGIVLFHDTFPGTEQMASPLFCGNGFLAFTILRKKFKNWDFVTIPVHPGLTIGSRKDIFPDWYQKLI